MNRFSTRIVLAVVCVAAIGVSTGVAQAVSGGAPRDKWVESSEERSFGYTGDY